MNSNLKHSRVGKLWPLLFSLLFVSPVSWADTKVRTSSFEYDASGLLVKEVVEPDRPNDCLQTSYGYDSYGNKTSVSTSPCAGASGDTVASAGTARTTTSDFGADGFFLQTVTNALGDSENWGDYDARFGAPKLLTGPNELATTWVYDDFGRKTREDRADGTYTTWQYLLCTEAGANCPGPIGDATITWVVVEKSYGANGVTNGPEKRQYHDTLDRIVRVQTQGFDGAGLVQDTEYNGKGQVARKSNLYALGGTAYWVTYTHDALGRVATSQVDDPDASGGKVTTTTAYNGLVVTTSTTNGASSQTKTVTKNAQGQVAQVTDTLGKTVIYTYDALGQLLSTNADGSITTLSYNQRGQKVAMVDPAMGAWEYGYNAFGEMVWQRDSLNQSSTMVYDLLGRLIQRTEPDLVSQWSYNKKFDGTGCGKGKGKLCEAKADNGYRRTHNYDTKGRPDSTATVLASPAVVSVVYDPNTGRVASKTWPTGYQASYSYNALGYLSSVTGGGTNGFTQTVSYQVQAMNPQGQITQYRYGNQVTTVRNHNAATGRLKDQAATKDGQGTGNVLAQTYEYDDLGNLKKRFDNSPGVGTQESFSYDSLNRLTLATIVGGAISPPQATEVIYDERGNIKYKSDVGRYWYDADRPNRMIKVTPETTPGALYLVTGTRTLFYSFDDYQSGAQVINGIPLGNGNLMLTVSEDTVNGLHTSRNESYTSFNMPSQIVFGNYITSTTSTADRTLSYVYGPEHQRIKQTVALSGNGTSIYSAGNTWYLNGDDGLGLSYEKEVKDNGTTENKHYVSAGGVVFAMFVSRTGNLNGKPTTSTNYFHHDHLGSLNAITDETGAVIERLAYDPWGKRRNINGVADVLDSIVGYNTDRGYTMHEHLDEVGVIHMNGRIYDPLVGRFMSADPFIQAPNNLQSYNRYAYVWNNPLGATDPSGYFLDVGATVLHMMDVAGAPVMDLLGHWNGLYQTDPRVRVAVAIAVAYASGQWTYAQTGNAVTAGAVGGGVSAFVSSNGDLRATAEGALTGALFGWAGTTGTGANEAARASSYTRYAAHAVAGCVSSAAGGRSCGSGAAAALFGKYATNHIQFGVVLNGVATVVAGGVGSMIAGEKFENGAMTAAYGYLFNQLMRGGQLVRNESSKRPGDVLVCGPKECVYVPPAAAAQAATALNVGHDNISPVAVDVDQLGTGMKTTGTALTGAGFVTGNLLLMSVGGVAGVAGSGLKFYAAPSGSSFLELMVDVSTEAIPATRFGAGVGLAINAGQAAMPAPSTGPLPQFSDLNVP